MRRGKAVIFQHSRIASGLGCRRQDLLGLVHHLLGRFILAGLQVGIKKKVHGMQFVSTHIHRTRLLRNGHRFQVRLDILLPQSEPGENVRRHVDRVGRRRRNLRIGAGGIQSRRRHLRRITGMNNVVRQAGMIRVLLEQRDKHRDRLLSGERRIVRRRAPATIMRRMRPPPGPWGIADRVFPSRPSRR